MLNLRRLFGAKPATAAAALLAAGGEEPLELEQSRTFWYSLAGPTHHVAQLRHFHGQGELDATIEQDKRNPADPNAIKVTVGGRLIGYFHAEDCAGFISWITWRGYDGRAFKAPAIVELDDYSGLLFGKLRVLLSPPRVVGDLDSTTRKAIDLILRQGGRLCVRHMQRQPGEPADSTFRRLVDAGLAARDVCQVCGARGYGATENTWVAKFGHGADFVRSNPDMKPVSGWVDPKP